MVLNTGITGSGDSCLRIKHSIFCKETAPDLRRRRCLVSAIKSLYNVRYDILDALSALIANMTWVCVC